MPTAHIDFSSSDYETFKSLVYHWVAKLEIEEPFSNYKGSRNLIKEIDYLMEKLNLFNSSPQTKFLYDSTLKETKILIHNFQNVVFPNTVIRGITT